MTRRLAALALILALATSLNAVAAGARHGDLARPAAVSPGDATRVASVATPCPTFSWAQVAGAERYELVVYRVDEDRHRAPVVLRQAVDGRAGSWTPTLERCLEGGGRYAWALRAQRGEARSPWSRPALFAVAPPQELLAMPRRQAAGGHGTNGVPGGNESGAGPASAETTGGGEAARATGTGSGRAPRGAAAALGLSVEGRVEAAAFSGDGAALANVEAAELTCAGCVAGPELADGAVTAAKIGQACAVGQVLMRAAAGWECATVTPPACAPGDELACYTGPAGTRGVGECVGGTRLCVEDSTWGPCSGEVTPAASEICDGLDNTCDGPIDEGDPAALCPLTANAAATLCDAASCSVTSCEPLWADADGGYANGCEAPAPGHCLEGGTPRPVVGPAEGELVIREVLADPASPLTDADGEWFEVVALAGVDLNGLELGTTFGTVIDQIDAADCLPAAAGDVVLFARSADPAVNGGLAPDHLFGFSLVNGGGELHLARDGNLIDAVAWGAGDVASGRARNLPPGLEDAAANDDPASWCNVPAEAAFLYADGNHGTPDAPNVECP